MPVLEISLFEHFLHASFTFVAPMFIEKMKFKLDRTIDHFRKFFSKTFLGSSFHSRLIKKKNIGYVKFYSYRYLFLSEARVGIIDV